MNRILVFQHHPLEHPGTFREFFAEDGVRVDVIRLDAGDGVPSLTDYDALIVMGGPQDVWQEDIHPWLATEKRAVREAVAEREMPYLGICLGHQLLADALGGGVALMPGKTEIGVRDVLLTSEGERDPLLGPLGPNLSCLQWHAAEVVSLPMGAVSLAGNSASVIQAMRYGERGYGLQFHVEATETTVPEWAGIPGYRRALERGLEPGELPMFEADARRQAAAFKSTARRIYERFRMLIG